MASLVLVNLLARISELDRMEIIADAGISDDRPPLLRGRDGSFDDAQSWAEQRHEAILPYLLRKIDPSDDEIVELVENKYISIGDVPFRHDSFVIKFLHPEGVESSVEEGLPLSNIAASSMALVELFAAINAANRPFGVPMEMPTAVVSRGSDQFSLIGPGAMGFGVCMLVACSGGILAVPLAVAVPAASLFITVGAIETALNWRNLLATREKTKQETLILRQQERKTTLEADKIELEIQQLKAGGNVLPAATNVPMSVIGEQSARFGFSKSYVAHLLNRALPTLITMQRSLFNRTIEVETQNGRAKPVLRRI